MPLVTICIPHWQAEEFMKPCLRSIRKHSAKYDLEIIVIDNGSQDGSLDYLKSLGWLRLVERPEEGPENWPGNVFTSWDRGLEEATGDYYITMHSDVFVKSDVWLDPFLETIRSSPPAVASGSVKLKLEHPLYEFQKNLIHGTSQRVKKLLGGKPKIDSDAGRYPRDYCAMYDTGFLKKHDIRFATEGHISGGHQVAVQIWEHGGRPWSFRSGKWTVCSPTVSSMLAPFLPQHARDRGRGLAPVEAPRALHDLHLRHGRALERPRPRRRHRPSPDRDRRHQPALLRPDQRARVTPRPRRLPKNTSLNRRGEPMVCSPTDALNMLYGSDLQFLIMENILIRKEGAPEFETNAG